MIIPELVVTLLKMTDLMKNDIKHPTGKPILRTLAMPADTNPVGDR